MLPRPRTMSAVAPLTRHLTSESPLARVPRGLQHHHHLRLARAPEVHSVWSLRFSVFVPSIFAFVFSLASPDVSMCFDTVRGASKSGRPAARRFPPVRLPSHGTAHVCVLLGTAHLVARKPLKTLSDPTPRSFPPQPLLMSASSDAVSLTDWTMPNGWRPNPFRVIMEFAYVTPGWPVRCIELLSGGQVRFENNNVHGRWQMQDDLDLCIEFHYAADEHKMKKHHFHRIPHTYDHFLDTREAEWFVVLCRRNPPKNRGLSRGGRATLAAAASLSSAARMGPPESRLCG